MNPYNLNNFTKIKQIVDDSVLDLTDSSLSILWNELYKSTHTHMDHSRQHWVYVDLNSDYVKKTDTIEEIDWDDLNHCVAGRPGNFTSGFWWIKILRPNISEFYNKDISDYFSSMNEIKSIDGLHAFDLAAIKDAEIVPHTDPPESGYTAYRLLCSVDVPLETDSEKLGFKCGDDVYSPLTHKYILFDQDVVHSAWNHTGQWWKFFVIDIDKKFYLR